jgi:catechol 2,3-dioxygenase-like lactoylglutathione lyase family enzyme
MVQTSSRLATALAVSTLPVTDIRCSRHFYEEILGLRFEMGPPSEMANGIVHAGRETSIMLYERPAFMACETTQLTLVVEDLEGVMDELWARGVRFEDYDLPYMKTSGGIATMGSARGAWVKDPDGNVISILQMQ